MRGKVKNKKKLQLKILLKNQNPIVESGKKLVTAALVTVLSLSFANSLVPKKKYANPGVSSDSLCVVAHAGGALEVGGVSKGYLNCVEGFETYHADGTRMFEYDFLFSKDGKLIATHKFEYLNDFNINNRITYEQFVNTRIAGKFEGMTEDKLFELIKENPDCKFILDTKEKNATKVYERIVNLANERGIDISKSVLPFVSSKEMLKEINNLYNFDEIMFTNYKKDYTTNQLIDIIQSCDKIKYLHIFPIDFFQLDIDRINQNKVRVFAHMDKSNSTQTALRYGCTGIFSDDISENEFHKNHYDFMIARLTPAKEFATVAKKENEIEM